MYLVNILKLSQDSYVYGSAASEATNKTLKIIEVVYFSGTGVKSSI